MRTLLVAVALLAALGCSSTPKFVPPPALDIIAMSLYDEAPCEQLDFIYDHNMKKALEISGTLGNERLKAAGQAMVMSSAMLAQQDLTGNERESVLVVYMDHMAYISSAGERSECVGFPKNLPAMSGSPPVERFRSCALMHSAGWSQGVSEDGTTYQATWQGSENAAYLLNVELDWNKDGRACEVSD